MFPTIGVAVAPQYPQRADPSFPARLSTAIPTKRLNGPYQLRYVYAMGRPRAALCSQCQPANPVAPSSSTFSSGRHGHSSTCKYSTSYSLQTQAVPLQLHNASEDDAKTKSFSGAQAVSGRSLKFPYSATSLRHKHRGRGSAWSLSRGTLTRNGN